MLQVSLVSGLHSRYLHFTPVQKPATASEMGVLPGNDSLWEGPRRVVGQGPAAAPVWSHC